MRNLFKSSSEHRAVEPRIPRSSSGWSDLYKHLQTTESLRVLDVGATSANNINFLTELGHSVYMANFVEDAAKPEWLVTDDGPGAGPGGTRFNIEGFVAENMNFSGRRFDVITLWDTLDFLPVDLVAPLVNRLHDVMAPGGKLLGFFHTKMLPAETSFSRYHLTAQNQVEMQKVGKYPLIQVFQNRQIERLFHAYSNYKFFLAKDNLAEVIVTR
jgi:SAM-dependent methyltransferase